MESQFFLLYLRKLIQKNTMEKKLAIKGHPTRGKEVIELLEMMGGVNVDSHKGHFPDEWKSSYYIYGDNTIQFARDEFLLKLNFVIFTLEEFLEKYPYKVGDKVCLYDNITEGCVTGMKWDKDKGTVKYCVYTSAEYWCDVEELSKWNATDLVERHDEEQCEEMNETQIKRDTEKSEFMIKHMLLPDKVDDNLEYNIINGYEFDRVENDKIILKPIKPKYPTNYQECCDALGLPMQNALEYINQECHKDYYYNDLQSTLNTFVSLKICRDAYWKIAGEQMGLGKLWKPEYSSLEDNTYFTIQTFYGEIDKSATSHRNTILVFPTVEMRDAFYENFKDLIKQCKELL